MNDRNIVYDSDELLFVLKKLFGSGSPLPMQKQAYRNVRHLKVISSINQQRWLPSHQKVVLPQEEFLVWNPPTSILTFFFHSFYSLGKLDFFFFAILHTGNPRIAAYLEQSVSGSLNFDDIQLGARVREVNMESVQNLMVNMKSSKFNNPNPIHEPYPMP